MTNFSFIAILVVLVIGVNILFVLPKILPMIRDLFLPKWQHRNQWVRLAAIAKNYRSETVGLHLKKVLAAQGPSGSDRENYRPDRVDRRRQERRVRFRAHGSGRETLG